MSLSIEPCEEGFQHHQSLLRDNNSFKDKVQQLPEIDFLHKSYTDTQSAALSLFGEGKKKKKHLSTAAVPNPPSRIPRRINTLLQS